MELLTYIILGLIQGITEPLPISSSGHLVIVQTIFGINQPGITFEAFINFGSTIAIIIYFFKDIKVLIVGFFQSLFGDKKKKEIYKVEYDYVLKLIVATIPLVIIGGFVSIYGLEFGDNIKNVSIALIITGLLLLLVSKKNGNKTIEKMSYLSILLIGFGQCIAILPGISRSGITLVFALMLMMTKEDAFKFSFMMYLPASFGAMIYSMYELSTTGTGTLSGISMYIISAIFAALATLVGVKIFKNILMSNKLKYFSMYCFFVGGTILISIILL